MPAEHEFDPEPILRALTQHGVTYIVVGGFAAAAHGVVRATADLDLVVERSWENAGRLVAALIELGAVDAVSPGTPMTRDVLVRRADRKLATPHGQLHLLHEVPGVADIRDFGPPEVVRFGDIDVPVANLADLREMKRAAGRDKDRLDLAELDELHGPDEPSAA
jgi:hypothetical protein